MTIKIEIPSDPEYKLLAAHIGRALYQYGSGADVNGVVLSTIEETKVTPPESELVFASGQKDPIPAGKDERRHSDVTTDQYEQLAADASQPADEDDESLPTLDGEGLPYDKRINSDPATINADGTWKARRKPKEMTKEEWSTYIDGVKAELRQALSGEPIVRPTATEETVVPPPVTDEQPEVVAPPVVTEETIAPPVMDDSELPERTFAELMKLITSNNGKITVARVNELLNERGVKSLPLLNTVRPDLIKVIYALVENEVSANG